MRPIVTYYGGKQKLASRILEMLPEHSLYVEPFAGGASVFFAKPPALASVINDADGRIVNLYEVVKNNFAALKKMVNSYPFSRSAYNTAYNIVKGRTSTNCKVTDAWALWYVLNFSYGRKIGGGFIYSGNAKRIKESILGYNNRKAGFTEHYQECLSYALIECADAIEIIRRYDNKDTLFYIDPPYYMANMGHYDGYTAADFVLLLQSLEGIKGKFLLSSYPCEVLAEYSQKNNWINKKQILPNNMKNRCVNKLPKVEVLTRNYQLLPKQYEQLTLLERSPS